MISKMNLKVIFLRYVITGKILKMSCLILNITIILKLVTSIERVIWKRNMMRVGL